MCCGKAGQTSTPASRNWTMAIVAGVVCVIAAVFFLSGNAQEPDVQPAAMSPGSVTPEPWFYDVVNNRYWHPGHADMQQGHWHNGPPPPPEQRETAMAPAAESDQPPSSATESDAVQEDVPAGEAAPGDAAAVDVSVADLSAADAPTGETPAADEPPSE